MVNRLKLFEKRMPHGRLAMLRDSCMSKHCSAWYLVLPLPFFTRKNVSGKCSAALLWRAKWGTKFGQPESGAHGQNWLAKALLPCDGLELVRGGQRIGQSVSSARRLLVLA